MISLISVLGIATGVAALIIVIGVMAGFDYELQSKIIGTNSHIVVDKIGGLNDAAYIMDKINVLTDVSASAPFINTQALIMDENSRFPVVMRGILPELEVNVTGIQDYLKKGSLDLSENNIVVGKELARQMFLKIGDKVNVVSLNKFSDNIFKIAGIFSSGMYDYDSGIVFVSIGSAKEFSDDPSIVNGISVKIKDVYNANKIKNKIQQKLGFPYFTRTWMDLNKNLFNALKLEKTAMFIILTLIVMVACLNIASSLIMLVMEKTRDIGILKTIGVSNAGIRRIFTIVGLAISSLGITLGVLFGIFISYLLKTYQFVNLPQDIYYIDKLPIRLETCDVLLIVLAAFCISLIATIYPAYQAAKLNPVSALRYE